MESELLGVHHLTAISARIRANHRFYTEVMGMRLVKRTVNQDDVGAYHLFYADGVGSPGTDLTFFDWDLPRERRGTRSVVRTFLRVKGEETLEWWESRLREHGVAVETLRERDGRATLDFEDPEGLRLSLVDDGGTSPDPVPREEGPVPADRQIRGLGPIMISAPLVEDTDRFLTEILHMRAARSYQASPGPDVPADAEVPVHVYEMDDGGPHAELHVAVEPHLPPARPGAGGVHHVAFRTPDEAGHEAWLDRLNRLGIPNSGPVDRYYFRSLYFREPAGALFEIATDGPGFTVDEEAETLGDHIALPPFLEPRRKEIVSRLAPLG